MRAWKIRGGSLPMDGRCLVMGIVNTTPDSFSDGGRYETADLAVAHAERLIAEGADLLDIGGESSRPGAEAVTEAEELARVLPVVVRLVRISRIPISIDTTKAAVARACLDAGAVIINDISAATADPEMAGVVRQAEAGLVIMHMRGTPRTMQANPTYREVVTEVRDYLSGRMEALVAGGIDPDCLVIDPGIGFGKTTAHNLRLIRELGELSSLGQPLVLGVSRKRFIGEITGKPLEDRLAGSLAVACHAAMANSARIVRVHDVGPTSDALRMLEAIARADTSVE